MSDVTGKKKKFTEIPAPLGVKVKGIIEAIKLSEKFEDTIQVQVRFPQLKKMSDDGSREFTKFASYFMPIEWSAKNKSGRVLKSFNAGQLPKDDEEINWTRLLLNKKCECIFENTFDAETGEPKGQKIKWLGAIGSEPEIAEEREAGVDLHDDFTESPV